MSVASASAYLGFPASGHYAAGKSGLISLIRPSAPEFAPFGLLINAVAPSATDTGVLSEQIIASRKLLRQIPLGPHGCGRGHSGSRLLLGQRPQPLHHRETAIASGGIFIA